MQQPPASCAEPNGGCCMNNPTFISPGGWIGVKHSHIHAQGRSSSGGRSGSLGAGVPRSALDRISTNPLGAVIHSIQGAVDHVARSEGRLSHVISKCARISSFGVSLHAALCPLLNALCASIGWVSLSM